MSLVNNAHKEDQSQEMSSYHTISTTESFISPWDKANRDFLRNKIGFYRGYVS